MHIPSPTLQWSPASATKACLLLVLFTIFLLSHPYIGITHDAVYYAADALRSLQPTHFEHEFFFSTGTQGNFSIFGWAYAGLIGWLGLEPAHLLLTVLSRTGWFLAAYSLAHSLAHEREVGILACLVLSQMVNYDGQASFYCAESFATPRIWAELLCLGSLSLWLNGHFWLAGGTLTVAAALHPLMTLPCGVLLLFQLPKKKLFIGSLALFLSVMLLALLEVEPFIRISRHFDPAWWDSIDINVGNVLSSNWKALDLLRIPMYCSVALSSLERHISPTPKKLIRTVLLMLLTCWGLWLGAEYFQLVLATQLQFWRAAWLAQVMAFALWAAGRRPAGRWRMADWTHVIAMVALISSTHWTALCVSFLLAMWTAGKSGQTHANGKSLQIILLAIAILLLPWDQFRSLSNWEQWYRQPAIFAVLLLMGVLLFQAKVQVPAALRVSACGIGALCCCWVLTNTLQQGWKLQPHADSDFSEVTRFIPEKAVILTANDLPESWLDLRRSHYVSLLQSVSVLFSHDMYLEYSRRKAHLFKATGWKSFLTDRGTHAISGTLMYPEVRPQAVTALCQDPVLDYVVLPGSLEGANLVAKVHLAGGIQFRSIYSCALRRT